VWKWLYKSQCVSGLDKALIGLFLAGGSLFASAVTKTDSKLLSEISSLLSKLQALQVECSMLKLNLFV